LNYSTMDTKRRRRPSSTPWRELLRYGLRRAFLSYTTGCSALAAVVLSCMLPWGQRELLPFMAGFHAAMLGFGLSVFGFTILGGKDDFFEPVMKNRGRTALS
jgi:hypothetical protein